MITDRNKINFVTICIGLCFLLNHTGVATAQATNKTQQEANRQQQPAQIQTQSQAASATISVGEEDVDKNEETNAIINEPANGVVHVFSPRLDYSNEWRPVGRGDPLKNDPTFDYSPPTLEHVRYWAETTKDASKEESGGSGSNPESNSINYSKPSKPEHTILAKPYAPNQYHYQQQHQHQHSHYPHSKSHNQPHPPPYLMKNAKGEIPLLQPKYTSVRRSYYAQPPTRLMPPPMQSNSPPINTFNVPMKPSPAANIEYRHHSMSAPASMALQSVSVGSHMKAAQHYSGMSTPSSSHSSASSPSMSWLYNSPSAMQHHHHHYAMSSSSVSPVSETTMPQTSRQPLSHVYDSYPQDTQHYVSYMRPSAHISQEHSYSPNSLRQSVGSNKYAGGAARKPWLHELLQKEVVKTSVKPSHMMTTMHSAQTHPSSAHASFTQSSPTHTSSSHSSPMHSSATHSSSLHASSSHSSSHLTSPPSSKFIYEITKPLYERPPSTKAISGSFTPVTPIAFVSGPPTIAPMTSSTTTKTTIYGPQTPFVPTNAMSPTPFLPMNVMSPTIATSKTNAPRTTITTTKQVTYTTAPPTTAMTTRKTTTTTPRTTMFTTTSRLLIPTTSNLASRPTVAPMRMTTDSLFSHYKQPEAPIRGPMYLIIEGHSKVKKYGKNGINLNLPKIVPVVPKREPVVRVAEPGDEKRGTPESFHVEHLHVKSSTPAGIIMTAKPQTTTTPKPQTTTSATTKTPSNTLKTSVTTKLIAMPNTTRTTMKPQVSSTTKSRAAAIKPSPNTNLTTTNTEGDEAHKSTAENAKLPPTKTTTTATAKPAFDEPLGKLELPSEPPTGMQGLFSLLDSSLGSLFAEQPLDMSAEMPAVKQTAATTTPSTFLATTSTILKALNSTHPQPQSGVAAIQKGALMPVAANSRIGTNANQILADDANGSWPAEFNFTTDMPPREVRQVYDYDQRPDSRLKDFAAADDDDGVRGEGASAFYEDDGEFEEYGDGGSSSMADDTRQPIKRIDQLIYGDEGDDEGEDGQFVGDYEEVELEELRGLDLNDARTKTKLT